MKNGLLTAVAASCVLYSVPARCDIEAGALLLQFPIHPRTVAMGGTGVADNTDPSTVYYNPANVIAGSRAYVVGARQRWPEDWFVEDLWMGRASAGASWRSDGSAVAWGVQFDLEKLDWGESLLTDPSGAPLGTASTYEKAASLALGIGVSGDRVDFAAGIAARKWWAEYPPPAFTQSMEMAKPDAYSFDIGIKATMPAEVDGWRVDPALAIALIDAGPDFEFGDGYKDPLPTRFNVGTSVHVESPTRRVGNAYVPLVSIVWNVDAMAPFDGKFEWGMGGELAVAQMLYVRTGTHVYHVDDNPDDVLGAWGIGLGVPLASVRVRFDYTRSGESYIRDFMGATIMWLF